MCQNNSASVLGYLTFGGLQNGGSGCQAVAAPQGNSFILPLYETSFHNEVVFMPGPAMAGGGMAGAPTSDIEVCTASSNAMVCCMQW